ncbi:MAG TPA: protein translocase subunit SecD [Gemmatimonadaceae bacterium]|nr:protein translocase subunit SecD [Gemmatimonadaceae bacterium]
MSNIQGRVIIIIVVTLASIWALWPRTVRQAVRTASGVEYRPVKRIPLKRGLDLQGGMHLSLEVDESKGAVANKSDALDRALTVLRNRIDQFGVAEPVVERTEDRIRVDLPGIDDPERAEALIKTSAFLTFQIVDEANSLERALPRIDAALKAKGADVVAGKPATPTDTGTRGALADLLTPSDSGKAVAQDSAAADTGILTGTRDGAFSRLLQPGGMPGEYFVSFADTGTVARYLEMPEVRSLIPPGRVVRWGAIDENARRAGFRPLYVLESRAIIRGDQHLKDARPNTDPIEGNLVLFELTNEGGRRFAGETGKHIGDYLAIVLDDIVMGQPPVIQDVIRTRGQITMRGKPLQEAQDLALVLRAGSLPVPLRIMDVRSLGPSLGEDAVDQGKRAGALGIILVIAIMVVYYRFSGVMAVAGLALYVLVTLAILAGFDAVLTLPGIAGFVLSIGMAVDANFLIFERTREELDRGKTVRTAINEGFDHALSAIIDTHATTALTALILYQIGTGPVRGFAVTLIAGIAASLFTAVFVVRTLFLIWLNRSRGAQTLSI